MDVRDIYRQFHRWAAPTNEPSKSFTRWMCGINLEWKGYVVWRYHANEPYLYMFVTFTDSSTDVWHPRMNSSKRFTKWVCGKNFGVKRLSHFEILCWRSIFVDVRDIYRWFPRRTAPMNELVEEVPPDGCVAKIWSKRVKSFWSYHANGPYIWTFCRYRTNRPYYGHSWHLQMVPQICGTCEPIEEVPQMDVR